MKKLKFVVEKHRDGYVAYPLGLKGAVVGQGESYESALADAKSAAAFHIESFGKEAFDDQDDVIEAFVTEASLTTDEIPGRCAEGESSSGIARAWIRNGPRA
jgi:predicted RNase H-like HicB family nuclease